MEPGLNPLDAARLEASLLWAKNRKESMNGFHNGVNGASAGTPAPLGGLHVNGLGTAVQAQDSKVPDVYRAIGEVAKLISRQGVAKGRRNEIQNYQFRGIDEVCNALSPLLAEANLCILPRMSERQQEERTTAKGGILFYVTVKADFEFVSLKDGSKHTVSMYGEGMDSADKATNKAMSAAYKYACLQVFCIPVKGQLDADADTPLPEPRRPNTRAAQEHVRDQKLAKMPPPKGDPKVQFAKMTRDERLKEFSNLKALLPIDAYVAILSRHGVGDPTEFQTLKVATACYQELLLTAHEFQERLRDPKSFENFVASEGGVA